MAQAQNGDRRAYARLLAGITPYIRALARRALRDPADIDEVVQDVLLTVHQMRHAYDARRPFAPWLTTIARRRIVDRLRANADHAARKVAATATIALGAADTSGDGPVRQSRLRQAINALPERQRCAIELLKLRGLSLKEASSQTGVSIGSLKIATHRAYKTLRGLLQRTS